MNWLVVVVILLLAGFAFAGYYSGARIRWLLVVLPLIVLGALVAFYALKALFNLDAPVGD